MTGISRGLISFTLNNYLRRQLFFRSEIFSSIKLSRLSFSSRSILSTSLHAKQLWVPASFTPAFSWGCANIPFGNTKKKIIVTLFWSSSFQDIRRKTFVIFNIVLYSRFIFLSHSHFLPTMTSSNKTLWAGNIAKSLTSEGNSVLSLTNIDRYDSRYWHVFTLQLPVVFVVLHNKWLIDLSFGISLVLFLFTSYSVTEFFVPEFLLV